MLKPFTWRWHYRCGVHSGIPRCCVIFWLVCWWLDEHGITWRPDWRTPLDRFAWERDDGTGKALVLPTTDMGGLSRTIVADYLRCPLCYVLGRRVVTRACLCGRGLTIFWSRRYWEIGVMAFLQSEWRRAGWEDCGEDIDEVNGFTLA